MCAKLKCCLNYEVDDYVEAGRKMPSRDVVLQTIDSDYYLFKSDILAGLVTYSTGKGIAANLETITTERARAIIEMNKRGEKPESLTEDGKTKENKRPADLLADADISRFDKTKKKKKKPQGKKPQLPKDAKQQSQQPKDGKPQQQYKEGKPQQQPQQPKDAKLPQQQQQPKEGRPQQRKDNRPQRQPKPQATANKKPNNAEQQQQ